MNRLLLTLLLLGFGMVPAQADPPDPNVDVLHYTFRLRLSDETDEVRGETTIVVRFRTDGVTALDLDLIGPAREGDRGMNVAAVMEDDQAVEFTHANDQLHIVLPAPSRVQEQRTFTITYLGTPADGLVISQNKYGERTFFGDNWPNRARHWLPSVDHPSDKALCEFIITALMAHEIAHQWFGDSITEADWPHIWLSEGFATYFTQLYMEYTYGRDRMVAGMQRNRNQVIEYFNQEPAPIVDTTITNLMGFLNPNSYQKGGWVLHMLRYVVGNEAFWDGIRAYYRQYRDGNAWTEDFQQVMETASGQDLGWFFQQWIYQAGHPRYEGAWHYEAASRQLTVTLHQIQTDGTFFRMPIEVGIYTDDTARPRIEVLDVDEQQNTFTFTLDDAPTDVVLDPNTWVLMEADFSRR